MRLFLRILVLTIVVASAAVGIAYLVARDEVERLARDWLGPLPPITKPARTYTLKERIDEIGPAARARLAGKFQTAGMDWPPAEVVLVALKDQDILELYARKLGSPWKLVHRFPVLKASGTLGPKLRQGDKQVPEGIYRVTALNPNSLFHVSLRLDYPNAFDQQMGAKDGRKELGGDIMIHGKAASVGCLAMGDEAAEELFVLAHTIGLQKMKVIIAPTDLRRGEAPKSTPGSPPWLPDLYRQIATALDELKS